MRNKLNAQADLFQESEKRAQQDDVKQIIFHILGNTGVDPCFWGGRPLFFYRLYIAVTEAIDDAL